MTSYISLYYKVSIASITVFFVKLLIEIYNYYHCKVGKNLIGSYEDMTHETHTIISTNSRIRAVAGQRSSPDLCFATKLIKIYDQ